MKEMEKENTGPNAVLAEYAFPSQFIVNFEHQILWS